MEMRSVRGVVFVIMILFFFWLFGGKARMEILMRRERPAKGGICGFDEAELSLHRWPCCRCNHHNMIWEFYLLRFCVLLFIYFLIVLFSNISSQILCSYYDVSHWLIIFLHVVLRVYLCSLIL